MSSIVLSKEHIDAINRKRRVIVNYDTGWGLPDFEERDACEFINASLEYFVGQQGSQVDSIWWCWGEMYNAPWPSRILPVNRKQQRWLKEGIDPLAISINKCREKGLEVFYTFRINSGSDFVGWVPPAILMENKDWGIVSPFWPSWIHYNFAVEAVRKYKLDIIREVVENYDYDGIEIDWRCGLASLPQMHGWEYRACITEFMRSVRILLLDIEKRKGKPVMLAARVPENIEGSHYDGLDVETWVNERLVDIFALGCHNFEVDIEAYRRLAEGKEIKLYPSIDDHHSSSGYVNPPIEVFRGVSTNFWYQGADGIYTFNFYPIPLERPFQAMWDVHRQAYCEMGSIDTLRSGDKTFVTQRRGGGGWPSTYEYYYANTNSFAQLPKKLADDENDETYIKILVGEKVDFNADKVGKGKSIAGNEENSKSIELYVLLSDTNVGTPEQGRINNRLFQADMHDEFKAAPKTGIEKRLRVRINGVILENPVIHDGWIVYRLKSIQLAAGSNVVAFKLRQAPDLKEEIYVEKMEIRIKYQG